MDNLDRSEWLTAADCAARTGLTVRALRVYEEYGLIAPRRSAGGWRLYGEDDLLALNTIALLKTAGLTLAQIRDVTQSAARAPSLEQILEIQLATWTTRREEAERAEAIARTALQRLESHGSLSIDDLCNLIRSFEMDQTSTPAGQEPDAVALEPAVLDRYVGFYALHGGELGVYAVTRDERKLIMQASGQPPLELRPTSETEFVLRPAEIPVVFECDEHGRATALVQRYQGMEIRAERVDEAAAEKIRSDLAERIAGNTPRPGSEDALRRLVEGIRAGAPDYDAMSPAFAEVIRRQLPRLQPIASYLGPIESIEFQGVGSQGWDVYDVHRERGTGRWRIALGSNGKILGAMAVVTSPVTLGP